MVDKRKLEVRLEVAAIIVGVIAALLSFYVSYKFSLTRYMFFGIIWIIIVIAILRTSIIIQGGGK
ncbi:MAG: hypothetical protein F7C81_03945 [Desulfurococcales archaeon]|nr:hypothetical protein [Desulfurococcales archaeon]